ncbi:hypothetical protein [Actibacterium sp. 188UL27-1]|uniref:hypothetical protein n=1 Tax=Actibacterium sp. 188UL27-1 TaxID=2786961 RepID=UPI00195DEDD3|nr:hypothetical protein [Actibacterium sp. 188UL27-1]MBM7067924.1 hypothetical protein [Actibacterium sp. 188UL27-1]
MSLFEGPGSGTITLLAAIVIGVATVGVSVSDSVVSQAGPKRIEMNSATKKTCANPGQRIAQYICSFSAKPTYGRKIVIGD